MVMSLDGSIVDLDGRSGGLSTPEDAARFLSLRRGADVILVGAGTVRVERYRANHQPVAIVSNSGRIPQDCPLLDGPQVDAQKPTIYTTQQAADAGHIDPRLTVVVCGSREVDLRRVIADFTAKGWDRIACEGGPTLLRGLLDLQLLDELRLSIVPTLMGTIRPIVAEGVAPQRLALASVEHEGSTSFLRLLVGTRGEVGSEGDLHR